MQVAIDTIVVLGLPGGPQGWSAQLIVPDGSSRLLPAAPGPLREGRPGRTALLVQAGLPVHDSNWALQLLPPPAGAHAAGVAAVLPVLALVALLAALLGHATWARWCAVHRGYRQLEMPGSHVGPLSVAEEA